MTNQGPRRTAADGEWSGRLIQAREFHESARSLVALAKGRSFNGAVTLMVASAIAYTDALTAKLKGLINQQDHQGAVRLMRETLGNRLPAKQEKFLRRLLGRKDEVNYGVRSTALDDAQRLLKELDEFAVWVEGTL